MFERILVPLDGSSRAERALTVVARLARAKSATVILARVIDLPTSHVPGSASVADPEALMAGERETATRYLEDVARRPELVGVTTQREVSVAAVVAPALLELIQTSRADLVVICRHGRTGFTRWRLGSVAQKIARHATVPTLILRSDEPSLAGDAAAVLRPLCALVPLDGSPEGEMALEPAARLIAALAAPDRGALHFLHVVHLEDERYASSDEESSQERLRLEAERYLRTVAERFEHAPLVGLSLDVTWSVVFDADVAAAILDQRASADHDYAMIAMASHGRSGWQLWMMGSVAERVLQTSALPLLIVCPQNPALAQRTPDASATGMVGDEIAVWPGYEGIRGDTRGARNMNACKE
jgi:nucleotide-binding universal stress UspA family protein